MAAEVIVARGGGLEAARVRAAWLRRGLTAATFLAIYWVLAEVMHPSLIFSGTVASGGDMGSHHYIALFLEHDLLPHFQITGWAPGWYAGFPMLQFYFPLPYLLMAALHFVLGDQVAFKVVTALGPFLLPVSAWGAFRLLRIPEPAPLLAAAAMLPFLMMTCADGTASPSCTNAFTIWGGNIASTMAGEFPYALGLALLPLALAMLYRATGTGRGWRIAAVLTGAIVLCHVLDTLALLIAAPFLVLRDRLSTAVRAAIRLAGILVLAFCLTATWALPFVVYDPYTAHFRWTQLLAWNVLAPAQLRPFLAFSVVGLGFAVVRRDRRALLFAWGAAGTILAYAALIRLEPAGSLWNARLLPYVYLFSLLVAAYGAAALVGSVVGLLRDRVRLPVALAYLSVVAVLAGAPVAVAWGSRTFVPYWTYYNYSGFQAKPAWPQAEALFRTIAALPPGRVMWEYNSDYEKYGTTRTLEDIPIFANHPSMEGLLIESSITAPFHFINQAETSVQQTDAVPGITYPQFGFAAGLEHLRMLGVRYYVAYTATTKAAARAAHLPVLARSGQFVIYQVGTGDLVEVPKYRPVLSTSRDWRDTALDWYENPALLDVPIVLNAADDPAARAAFPETVGSPLPATLPKVPLAHPGPIANGHMVGPNELDFTTTAIGEPTIVKVSWFPNWHAVGAEGPWMVSPSLMVVIPTQAHVRLVYQDTPVDRVGNALTIAGFVVLCMPSAAALERWWRRRRAVPPAGPRPAEPEEAGQPRRTGT